MEIEMDESGTISDLDQSLRNFPMRLVEATEDSIVMSELDFHVTNDAQETITTRESFEEAIDRYAVTPSVELFCQKTRSVGLVAPDGKPPLHWPIRYQISKRRLSLLPNGTKCSKCPHKVLVT